MIPAIALHADVIEVTYYDGGISASLEGIVCIEKSLSKRTSMSLWGGGGAVVMLLPEFFKDYNAGIEGALEFRFYPQSQDMERIFFGLYAGIGHMYGSVLDDYEYISTVGFKICNKNRIYVRDPSSGFFSLALEPYISAAVTWYYRYNASMLGHPDEAAFWVNVGFRVTFENTLR
jgi:hypothetical protein